MTGHDLGVDEAAAPGRRIQSGYDELEPTEQARVRAEWAAAIRGRIHDLDLAADFANEGRSWVEADGDGEVVRREPDPGE